MHPSASFWFESFSCYMFQIVALKLIPAGIAFQKSMGLKTCLNGRFYMSAKTFHAFAIMLAVLWFCVAL